MHITNVVILGIDKTNTTATTYDLYWINIKKSKIDWLMSVTSCIVVEGDVVEGETSVAIVSYITWLKLIGLN